MAKHDKVFNPFYVILLACGIAFFVTACGYGLLSVREMRADQVRFEPGIWMQTLDAHGTMILGVELAMLVLASVAAIGTDDYWIRRGRRRPQGDVHSDPIPSRGQSDEGPTE